MRSILEYSWWDSIQFFQTKRNAVFSPWIEKFDDSILIRVSFQFQVFDLRSVGDVFGSRRSKAVCFTRQKWLTSWWRRLWTPRRRGPKDCYNSWRITDDFTIRIPKSAQIHASRIKVQMLQQMCQKIMCFLRFKMNHRSYNWLL